MNPSKVDIGYIYSTFGVAIPEGNREIFSPVDGMTIGGFTPASADQVGLVADRALAAFSHWRSVPAPRRGELVRRFGEALRARKTELGLLVTLDCGKPLSEGLGEVQEMIDICDFAVGLSRQLHGLTIASERPGHRMSETWHPLGPVAIITAFNFPVAVWAWNAALALVCGDSIVWKPSEKTPLTAIAVSGVFSDGFHTMLSPQTRASAAFQAHTATGKLNAVMIATGPSGCQVSLMRWPGRSLAMVRPCNWRERPTAKSQISIISCTSPSPSDNGLPQSSVTSRPSSVLRARNASPKRRTSSPRRGAGTERQWEKAARARSATRPT